MHSVFFGRPGQSATMIRLCMFFFSYALSLPCSGKVIYSHRRLRAGGCQGLGSTDTAIVWNIKCVNVKVLGTWISSAWCQRHSVMQSVTVGQ